MEVFNNNNNNNNIKRIQSTFSHAELQSDDKCLLRQSGRSYYYLNILFC